MAKNERGNDNPKGQKRAMTAEELAARKKRRVEEARLRMTGFRKGAGI